jgi:hypothetical protein
VTKQEAKWKKGDKVKMASRSWGYLVGVVQSIGERSFGPKGGKEKFFYATVKWCHEDGDYVATTMDRLGRDDLKWEGHE